MRKWSNGAKRRLVEIRAAEDGDRDMRALAAAMQKLPPRSAEKGADAGYHGYSGKIRHVAGMMGVLP